MERILGSLGNTSPCAGLQIGRSLLECNYAAAGWKYPLEYSL